MINPLQSQISPTTRLIPSGPPLTARPAPDAGSDFASMLRQQLEKVSAMQNEADQNVQQVLTGQSDDVTGVFVAARKAEVAFSLLMEIRNKLVDSYEELRQLRV